MKFKLFLSLALAGASLGAYAQTHLDGIDYYKAGQLDNAIELLQRNMNNSGTDKALSYYYIGKANQDYGYTDKAKSAYEAGIAANPECAYNYVGLASVELKNGDVKGAEANLKLAEKFAKKDAALQIEIARAYYNANPVTFEKQIAKAVEKARKFDMQDPAIYLFEGDRLRDQGGDNETIGKAANMYEMAANYDNQAAAAYVKYAKLFRNINNHQQAIRILNQLLAANPNSALGQRELALTYSEMNDFKNAAAQYGKYVKNPNHFKQDENEYAFLLFYNGEYKNGYDYASQLLKANPNDFVAQRYQFMNASQLPEEFGDQLLPMAESLFAKNLQNPEANKLSQVDYNLLIGAFINAKQFEEAEKAALAAINQFPNVPNYKESLAKVYSGEKRYDKAADAMNGYIATLSEPKFSNLYYGAVYNTNAAITTAADADKSAQYLAKAKEFADKAASTYKTVAAYRLAGDTNRPLKEGDVDNSIPYYENGIAVYEAEPKANDAEDALFMYAYLSKYYKEKGDADKAAQYATKANEMAQ